VRLAFASGVWAHTSDLRCLFRCLTLGATVLARHRHARTERVCTLLCFLRSHFFPPNFGSRSDDPSPNASLQERVLLYRKEHFCDRGSHSRAYRCQSIGFRHRAGASLRDRWTAFCGCLARESAGASPASRVSNCEQMFAPSRVILCVHSVGRKRRRSLSTVSFFSRGVQALAVSNSEGDYIRSRTKQISPPCVRDLKEQR
jgi:hypothetical protein